MKRLKASFFKQDVLIVAPLLLGKLLVRKSPTGEIKRYRITETEAYRGEEDTACHAKVGKTNRTYVLYKKGGFTYVYLCYGIHYLFNIVTGKEKQPQAVLIRGIEGYDGPAKLSKALLIDKSLNDIDLSTSNEVWVEDDGYVAKYTTSKRIGIDYATELYREMEWRFIIEK